ncbi:MAG: hypothetical protein SGJ16_13885 [Nitrospirota bacterium]|nr:hypothetical protein [Nitrospirota bacterium]
MWIESTVIVNVHRPTGTLRLLPGQPVELPEIDALKILAKAGNRVRLVSPMEAVVMPPAPLDAKPVYFIRNDGVIYGPATVLDLVKVDEGASEHVWLATEYHGDTVWIRSDRLRSQHQYERQTKPKRIELEA